MNADVAIAFDTETGRGDLRLGDAGELLLAPPIVVAVYVSLFTDRRAGTDDPLPPGEDPRGWWGALLDGKPIGSRLWLLRRAKHEPNTLKRARDYLREALEWLVEDGLAARVDVAADWQGRSRIAAVITLRRADGAVETVTASWAWQGA